jgi:hypothetical protein
MVTPLIAKFNLKSNQAAKSSRLLLGDETFVSKKEHNKKHKSIQPIQNNKPCNHPPITSKLSGG